MAYSTTSNGEAQVATSPKRRSGSPPAMAGQLQSNRTDGAKAAVIQAGHDATLSASKAAQIVAGNDMAVHDSKAMLMVAYRDLQVENSGSSVMAAGRDLSLMNGGAACMVAGNQLTATNAGAGILCAGNSLTVQNGGAPVQLAGKRVDTASQGALLVAGCTVHAERSTLALAVGYDVHVTAGSQVIVAVSLRSFVDMLVGVAFLVPVQVGRRLARRAAG